MSYSRFPQKEKDPRQVEVSRCKSEIGVWLVAMMCKISPDFFAQYILDLNENPDKKQVLQNVNKMRAVYITLVQNASEAQQGMLNKIAFYSISFTQNEQNKFIRCGAGTADIIQMIEHHDLPDNYKVIAYVRQLISFLENKKPDKNDQTILDYSRSVKEIAPIQTAQQVYFAHLKKMKEEAAAAKEAKDQAKYQPKQVVQQQIKPDIKELMKIAEQAAKEQMVIPQSVDQVMLHVNNTHVIQEPIQQVEESKSDQNINNQSEQESYLNLDEYMDDSSILIENAEDLKKTKYYHTDICEDQAFRGFLKVRMMERDQLDLLDDNVFDQWWSVTPQHVLLTLQQKMDQRLEQMRTVKGSLSSEDEEQQEKINDQFAQQIAKQNALKKQQISKLNNKRKADVTTELLEELSRPSKDHNIMYQTALPGQGLSVGDVKNKRAPARPKKQ